jgi:RNA polymerase sigma-70 factor (ECF subfamily)
MMFYFFFSLQKMIQQTEKIAFWFDEYHEYLFQFAYSKVKDRELAKDLVQDTFVSAQQSPVSFQEKSSPQTWLVSILKNKIIDFWRKEKRQQTTPESKFFINENEKGAGRWLIEKAPHQSIASHDTVIEEQERQQDLEACLENLPAQWNAVVQAKYFL